MGKGEAEGVEIRGKEKTGSRVPHMREDKTPAQK